MKFKLNPVYVGFYTGYIENLLYELEGPENYTLKDLIEHIESNRESVTIKIFKDCYTLSDLGHFSNGILILRSNALNPIMEENPKLLKVTLWENRMTAESEYHISIPYNVIRRYL